jgi:PAS domain S-box-containing protein
MTTVTVTLEALREQTKIPVVIFDRNGRLVFANEALGTLLIWKPDELLGLPVSTVFPKRFLRIPEPEMLPSQPVPGTARQSDGREIDAELTLIAGNEGTALHYAAMIQPIAEQQWFHYIPFEEEI